MDKCLRSLLISLAGAESEVNSSSISELARCFLASDSSQSPELVREKAGLLALLNLMGILEAFYSTGDSVESEGLNQTPGVSTGTDEGQAPAAGQAYKARTTPPPALQSQDSLQLQPIAALASLLSGISGPAPAQGRGQSPLGSILGSGSGGIQEDNLVSVLSMMPKLMVAKEGKDAGIDPSLLTALLRVISSIGRTRAQQPTESSGPGNGDTSRPQGAGVCSDCGEDSSSAILSQSPLLEEPYDSEFTGSAGEIDSQTDGKSDGSAGQYHVSPGEHGLPSRDANQAHQPGGVLGLDPRLITSLFNFLAGLDLSKSKSGGRHEKPSTSGESLKKEDKADPTGITLSEDGKSIVTSSFGRPQSQPPSLSEFLRQPAQSIRKPAPRPITSHKPGIGIQRGWMKKSPASAVS